jgi:aspartate/methionine/tyrosine aminotransferase
MAGYLLVDEGDEIIIPDLYWENYDLLFGNAYGGRLRPFPMFAGRGFNVAGLRAELGRGSPGKRLVLLNFPNNPTGYTATEQEARELRDALVEAAERGCDVAALIDDAYFGLVYEKGILSESMFGLLAGAHERLLAVKFDGPTKEDYVWGFRVGFVTFGCARNSPAMYEAMERKLAGAIRGNISNVANLSQSLLAAAYRDPAYGEQKRAKYTVLRRRYEEIRRLLDGHPEYGEVVEPLPYNSGYFMCLKVRPGIDAEALRQRLLSQYGVGVIALGPLVRIAFSSTPLPAIARLLESIYRAGLELKNG